MAWVRTWFSRLSKVGICEDGSPKTPKIIQHSVSPIQFCQTTFGRGLFRGKGIRVLSHSKECHMGKHLAKDASLEWIKLAKPQISKWCRYDILINQSLASHELANTGTSNLKSHWKSSISKHWDEKVGSVCCPRSCPEMTLQYNHRNIFASTDISMIQFWTSFRERILRIFCLNLQREYWIRTAVHYQGWETLVLRSFSVHWHWTSQNSLYCSKYSPWGVCSSLVC